MTTKRFLSLVLALAAAFMLAVPTFAVESPAPDALDGEFGGVPPLSLYDRSVLNNDGTWNSVRFCAVPNSGNFIRFSVQNDTDEAVRAYFYRTDVQFGSMPISPVPVKMIAVPAHASKAAVFNGANADSGTYFIRIEAYVSGGLMNGNVAVSQYAANPGA